MRTDERLRIVSDDLWKRVKARQVLQSRSAGERVKTGLSRRRPGKYLLTGLLRCAACEASFQLSNGTRYQCASHHNGGDSACAVSLTVPRLTLEQAILNCVHADLLNPGRLSELEKWFTVAQPARVDTSALLAKLTKQERNLTAAIADGGDIPALLGALKEVQAERAKLQATSGVVPISVARKAATEPVERRAERMRAKLAQGGEVARSVLAELFPQSIWLQAESDRVYAQFEDGVRAALFDDLARSEDFPLIHPQDALLTDHLAPFAERLSAFTVPGANI